MYSEVAMQTILGGTHSGKTLWHLMSRRDICIISRIRSEVLATIMAYRLSVGTTWVRAKLRTKEHARVVNIWRNKIVFVSFKSIPGSTKCIYIFWEDNRQWTIYCYYSSVMYRRRRESSKANTINCPYILNMPNVSFNAVETLNSLVARI